MNRIDRIAAILIQLQSKRLVKGNEIAERFDISLRTVYRDIQTLIEAGVPILSETGIGYSIMEGYRLPPIMFTREEALAFLTAEKLVQQFTDETTSKIYQSALFKIKAVLRSEAKDHVDLMNDAIEVMPHATQPYVHGATNYIQQLLEAIAQKNILEINYFSNHAQQKTIRLIEPIGIYLSFNRWHLIAYCQLRKDYRNFRVDRIQFIKNTSAQFSSYHPSLKSYLKLIIKEDSDLHEVVIRINKEATKYLGEQKYYNGYIGELDTGSEIEMSFLTSSLEGFARWFMLFGDQAQIIKPQSLKTRIKRMAEALLKKVK